MQRVLSLARRPALPVSLRFFLSAAVFALAAALVLAWHAGTVLQSRWMPALLACTHLMVLGALTMTMAGALLQIVPVLFDVELAFANDSAAGIHLLLTTGTLLLAGAFFQTKLFAPAVALLLLAVAWLLAVLLASLWQAQGGKAAAILAGIKGALACLLVTVVLGGAMAAALVLALPLDLPALADLHAMWGLGGWVGMLLVAISFQVLPMFQVTPLYPAWFERALLVAIALGLLSARQGWLLCAYGLFSVATLVLLARRKRPALQATTGFWLLSMLCMLAAALLQAVPAALPPASRVLLLGMLLVYGVGWTAISGMLYQILPFLLWLHWQEQGLPKPVRSIGLVMPERHTVGHLACHTLALLLLAASTVWPLLTRSAALAACAAALYLIRNMLHALALQQQVARQGGAFRAGS